MFSDFSVLFQDFFRRGRLNELALRHWWDLITVQKVAKVEVLGVRLEDTWSTSPL
jgi:hypothetical protein